MDLARPAASRPATVEPACAELVVWDVDRTLLDAGPATHEAFSAAVTAVLQTTGFETRGFGTAGFETAGFGTARLAAGPELTGRTDPSVAREMLLAAHVDPRRVDQLVAAVLGELPAQFARFRDRFLADGRVLPGVREVVAALYAAGVRQTVLTGNVAANARLKLELFGLTGAIGLDAGAYGDDAERREDLLPLVLSRVARSSGPVDPGRTWLIGDTPGDLVCARAGGVRCLLVGTGLYPAAELGRLGADAVADDLADGERVLSLLGLPPN